jgi:toxin ParE1/3/4
MAHVHRFRRAEEDLQAIANHIAADSPMAASKWLDKIERTLVLLASNPLMGEDVGHLQPMLRRFSQGSYLLFFEPRSDGINLVRVLHGARDLKDLRD